MSDQLNRSLYSTMLRLLKVIPMIGALCYALNTFFSIFDIELIFLSYFAHFSILALLFLYICSYVFRFCEYHRMFLHYMFFNELLNIVDYYWELPISNRGLFAAHVVLVCLTLFFVLFLYVKERHKAALAADYQ